MYAIYIHIVADALGSVSVLVSSFLIHYYGLNFMDPLSSIFISMLILYSAWPVLTNSMFTLIHVQRPKMIEKRNKIESKV
jgi:zinc transporter 5/7